MRAGAGCRNKWWSSSRGSRCGDRRPESPRFIVRCALGADIDRALDPTCHPTWNQIDSVYSTEMVIVDEADRLRTTGLEQLRDFFDRRDLGMILIGMPGFDRQLARYPQLYSRIGFAHKYKPLDSDDLLIVLANYWPELGLLLDAGDANDVETVSAIIRITGGNFRLIERLMSQVARVMEINQLDTLDPDVIHAARQMLVVG